MPLGIAPSVKLQFARLNFSKQFKPCNEGSNKSNLMDGDHFRSHRDEFLRFFSPTIVNGTFRMAVLSARRVVKDTISPKSSAKFSNLEQPERTRTSIDFDLYKLLGRSLSSLQSSKSITESLPRCPMDS